MDSPWTAHGQPWLDPMVSHHLVQPPGPTTWSNHRSSEKRDLNDFALVQPAAAAASTGRRNAVAWCSLLSSLQGKIYGKMHQKRAETGKLVADSETHLGKKSRNLAPMANLGVNGGSFQICCYYSIWSGDCCTSFQTWMVVHPDLLPIISNYLKIACEIFWIIPISLYAPW